MSSKSELQYVRIYDFKLIPDRFFEAKGASFDLDYIKGAVSDLPLRDGNIVLYAMIDKDHIIRGVLWVTFSLMSRKLTVCLFSVDKEYQDKNNIKTAMQFVKDNCKIEGITTVHIATTRVKAFEKYGAKKSNLVNMEMELWAQVAVT